MTISPQLFGAVVVKAQSQFWKTVVEAFPKATSGDFPPDLHTNMERAIIEAVAQWLTINYNPKPFEAGYHKWTNAEVHKYHKYPRVIFDLYEHDIHIIDYYYVCPLTEYCFVELKGGDFYAIGGRSWKTFNSPNAAIKWLQENY